MAKPLNENLKSVCVDAKKFEEFKTSESMGSFLGQKIKGHHEFTKIIEKKDDK